MCQVAEVVWNFAGGGDDLFGFSIFQHRIAVYHPIHQYLPTNMRITSHGNEVQNLSFATENKKLLKYALENGSPYNPYL